MTTTRLRNLLLIFFVVALGLYASHAFEEQQAYKTGVYIAKAAFAAEDTQNRRCLSLAQRDCAVNDLNNDAAMERALAGANIIPALADSIPLHTGFRDGWREASAASFTR